MSPDHNFKIEYGNEGKTYFQIFYIESRFWRKMEKQQFKIGTIFKDPLVETQSFFVNKFDQDLVISRLRPKPKSLEYTKSQNPLWFIRAWSWQNVVVRKPTVTVGWRSMCGSGCNLDRQHNNTLISKTYIFPMEHLFIKNFYVNLEFDHHALNNDDPCSCPHDPCSRILMMETKSTVIWKLFGANSVNSGKGALNKLSTLHLDCPYWLSHASSTEFSSNYFPATSTLSIGKRVDSNG